MKNILTKLNIAFDFFLPRVCPSCNNSLTVKEECICSNCLTKIQKVTESRLQYEFKNKFEQNKFITDIYSLYLFEKDKELQSIVHSIKYEQKFVNAKYLGNILGEAIKIIKPNWEIDFIIPVPLHSLKKIERGFNQSFYISKGIAKKIDAAVVQNILKRKRWTDTQTKMDKTERMENVKEAFTVSNPDKINSKNILLVDDIITTGSTISECGRQLLNAGANKVFASSIAFAD